MQFLIGSAVFILGAIIGSFLNVLVLRRGSGIGLLRGSFCFSCSAPLRPHELIPVVSFFLQEGRCRQCKSGISLQYPLVEILTGGVFLAIAYKTGLLAAGLSAARILYATPSTLYAAVIASILLAITTYDIRHKIIPNAWVYLFNFLAFASLLQLSIFPEAGFAGGASNFQFSNFWTPFFTGIGFFLFFAAFWYFSRGRWMGLGDGKLALGIGWLLGFSGGLAALILSFWIGALVGLALLLRARLFRSAGGLTMKSEIPFAPFLILGTGLAWFFDITFSNLQALFMF